ncbi:hypothetical protein MFLAVUS_010698 [Mucor flavus]|uniref:Zinc-binding domain-containing protein n=1 Tax=Mucor flavus TaxID=439312 RepID=A0ABP9ZDL0_9FUNG
MAKRSQPYDKPPFTVCIVRYTCPTCCRRWHSANGNLDDYQICKNCYEKCYPGPYKYQAPNKKGNQNPETYIPHNTELCGKCIRLGHSCMEELGLERPNRVVSNLEGESVILDDSQDFSSYFTLATVKTKPEKKKPAVSKKMQQLRDKQAWSALMDAGKKKQVVKEDNEDEEQIIPNVVNEDEALYDNISEDKEETPASNKKNVAPEVSDSEETVADTNYCDDVDNETEDIGTDKIGNDNNCADNYCADNIGTDNIDADRTDNNITDNESSGGEEKSTSDNTEGTTTPVAAEEDSKSTCSNETTEDFTLENLSIADIKSNDELKEEYGDKNQ